MSWTRRPEIALFITGLTGTLVLLEYYIKDSILTPITTELQNWGAILASIALIIGSINLLMRYVRTVRDRVPNQWYQSILAIFLLVSMVIAGLVGGTKSDVFTWFYKTWYVPASATGMCMISLFLVYACYRSFKARSLSTLFLLISAIIISLSYVPIGSAISSLIPALGNWIITVPNTGTMRGIALGAGIGAVVIGFRQILGYERRHIGIEKTEKS